MSARIFYPEAVLYRLNYVLYASLGLGAVALIAQQSTTSPPATGAPQQPQEPVTAPQTLAPAPPQPTPLFGDAYPKHPPVDPAIVTRGKQVFSANCSFCHGSDARGGEQGPNLIRSELVLNDKDGELILPVVQNGRLSKGMPKFDLAVADIHAIAGYLHSVPVGGRAETTGIVNPLVGDAKAGEVYFNGAGKCASCHSVTGDLQGIGGRITDVKALQGSILTGEKRGEWAEMPHKTVTVTAPNGQSMTGTLDQIDDFLVGLTDSQGNYHSYVRHGAIPKVVVVDPLQPHLDMLRTFKDDDVHNLTAYLVTLK
jgi:cytochrome c oxidase cbb3-type subunit 3